MYTLDEREGWLYVKEVSISFCDPIEITHYWPTGIRYATFTSWFASPEQSHEALGKPVQPLCNPATRFRDAQGWTYKLPDGAEPDATETRAIPEPKQRGKKLPLKWHQGAWHKETSKGLVRA